MITLHWRLWGSGECSSAGDPPRYGAGRQSHTGPANLARKRTGGGFKKTNPASTYLVIGRLARRISLRTLKTLSAWGIERK